MKYIFSLLLLIIGLAVLYKMKIFNNNSAGSMENYSYTSYNWTFDQVKANAIIQHWKDDARRESAVRKLMSFDLVFIILYLLFLCNLSYTLLQQQNRLWLNIWLRMGIFSIALSAILNLTQDYFIYISLDTGRSVIPIIFISIVKWIFVSLAVIPVILTWLLKPVKTL